MTTDRLRYERADRALDVADVRLALGRPAGGPGVGRAAVVREHRYLTSDPHEHAKDATEWLDRARDAWEDGEAATWAIFARDGEPVPDTPLADGERVHVGVCTLVPLWEKRQAFTGVTVHRPFWGRGYSGERAAATARVAFERLDLEYVTPAHQVNNENSERAISKYVERWNGRRDALLRNWVPTDDGPVDLIRYTFDREGWREGGRSPEVAFGDE